MQPAAVDAPWDPALLDRLAARTLDLVNIPSVSRHEAAILAHVEAAFRGFRSLQVSTMPGQGLFAIPELRAGKPLVVLAGHLDTVPEQANLPGRLDGRVLHGLGASDMKASLAVMIELASWLDGGRPATAVDLAFLFFNREELPISDSALPVLFNACPELRQASLVIVMEPTDCQLQLGCLGNLNVELTFLGKSAHSARPWHGENALHKAIAGLAGLASFEQRPVQAGDLTFVEVLNLTRIQGGIAGNVIPDRVTAHVNFRYASDRSPAEAEAYLRRLAPAGATFIVLGNAPPARAAVDNPLVDALRRLGNLAVEPKQAWTPVAEFSLEGLDAINFGPGFTAQAHQRDEHVDVRQVARAYELLRRFAQEAPCT